MNATTPMSVQEQIAILEGLKDENDRLKGIVRMMGAGIDRAECRLEALKADVINAELGPRNGTIPS